MHFQNTTPGRDNAAAAAAMRWTRVALAARFGLVILLSGWLGIFPAGAADANPGLPPLTNLVRIGIDLGTWGGVNRNDANAAIMAWAKVIMKQRGDPVEIETQMFDTPAAARDALAQSRVDAVTMLTDQFLSLEPGLQLDAVYLAARDHSVTERYVLLVHRDAGIAQVGGLAGRKLVLQANARTSLALPWLDVLLARHSLGPAATALGALTKSDTPSKAVLKVFFHQADACLVTSNVFELACELNPQLRKELKVLAVSPEVVPTLFFFRPDFVSSVRHELEPAILDLHKSPAGIQVLTVFQCDRMMRCPLTSLDSTRELLAEYERSRQLSVAEKPTNAPPTASKP